MLYFVGLSNGIIALVVGLPLFIAVVASLIDGLVHLPSHATWLHEKALKHLKPVESKKSKGCCH